ncbi:MAG: phosphoribosylglycinamide formyltransferase [Halothiobacillus sp.]
MLISGNGSNSQAMIDACARGSVAADIVQVISNRPDAFGLVRAQNAGIPTAILDHKNFPDRAGFDAALADLIEQSQPDWVVLAGFMRILTPEFVQRFLGKLINIHPSLLPKYPGLDTHARALEAGDAQHGATVHFVTPTIDAGPVIIQGVLTIQPHESLESLTARVHQLEHRIYPAALAALVAGDVKFEDARTVWADGASNDSPRQMHA